MKKLSIGITTYKRPGKLKRLLEQIRNQKNIDFLEIEIVVSDNASEDETENVISQYKDYFPIIYFKNHINIGADRNIVSLIEKCSGEYLWFVPDDDVVFEESIFWVLQAIAKNPSVNCLVLNLNAISLINYNVIKDNLLNIEEDCIFENGIDILSTVRDVDLLTALSIVVKRNDVLILSEKDEIFIKTNLSPLIIAITALKKGKSIIISEPIAGLGIGDNAKWRKFWTYIYYISMPEYLQLNIEFIKPEYIKQNNNRRMKLSELANSFNFKDFLLRKQDISWKKLINIYGLHFFIYLLLLSPFFILKNSRLLRKRASKDSTNN